MICNNTSSDGTTEYLKELAIAKEIRVINHATKCGPDENIIHCIKFVAGKFVWITGDDVPLGCKLNSVMDSIEREDLALMYLPSKWVKVALIFFYYKIESVGYE